MTTKENKLREEITKLLGYINYEKSNWKEETTDWIIESIHQQIESSIPDIEEEFDQEFPVIHYKCDDCWYSCPLSESGCCNEEQPKVCNCGEELRSKETKSFLITKLKNII